MHYKCVDCQVYFFLQHIAHLTKEICPLETGAFTFQVTQKTQTNKFQNT